MAHGIRCTWLFVALTATGCFDPDHGEDLAPAGGESSSGGGTTGVADASSGSTGGDEGEESSSSSSGGVDACPEYCSLIGDHCQDDDAQYDGEAICEATCANMPVGDVSDELGNSASCRTFHAVLAAEDPQLHCPHAGPAGDGTCGANCESFCSIAQSVCAGDLAVFSGTEDCIAACEGFPTEPRYTGEIPDEDSFACRLRHLTLASLQPEVHCSHIGLESPVCL